MKERNRSKRKKWVIAAIVLLVIGILVCGTVFVVHGFDLSSLSGGQFETNTVKITEDFRNIVIQADTDQIVFAPSEDGECRVVFYENENRPHQVKMEDQTLTILSEDNREWYGFFDLLFETPKITIYLPQAEYGDLTVEASTGDIDIPEGFLFENIDIDITTGSAACLSSARDQFSIKASTGDITAGNFSAEDISLSVTTGRIDCSSVESTGNIDVHVSTGRAVLKDVTCVDLYSDGSTGDLDLQNVIASGEFHLERSTGDIRFDRCDAETVYAKTSTGDVKGTLLSDKIFITDTGTGDIDVPGTTEGGKCEINTGTGDIRIEIAR